MSLVCKHSGGVNEPLGSAVTGILARLGESSGQGSSQPSSAPHLSWKSLGSSGWGGVIGGIPPSSPLARRKPWTLCRWLPFSTGSCLLLCPQSCLLSDIPLSLPLVPGWRGNVLEGCLFLTWPSHLSCYSHITQTLLLSGMQTSLPRRAVWLKLHIVRAQYICVQQVHVCRPCRPTPTLGTTETGEAMGHSLNTYVHGSGRWVL